jgi:hypothetical protein
MPTLMTTMTLIRTSTMMKMMTDAEISLLVARSRDWLFRTLSRMEVVLRRSSAISWPRPDSKWGVFSG